MDVDTIFKILWFTPSPCGWGLPTLFTGQPGTTKTAQGYAWAKEMKVPFLHLSPGQKGPEYFGVVPVPKVDPVTGQMVLHFPSNVDVDWLCRHGRGLILLDELRSAPQAVRTALLGLLQERMFGDRRLPVGVRVFAASNSAAEATNGRALGPADANRVCHLPWEGPSSRDCMAYGIRSASEDPFAQRGDPDLDYSEWAPIEEAILSNRARVQPGLAAVLFSFTEKIVDKDGNELLHSQPKAGKAEADGPWASRRSWMNLLSAWTTYRILLEAGVIQRGKDSNGVAAAEDHEDPNLRAIARGLIGEGAAELLWTYVRAQDLPDFADWLDGKAQVRFDRARADRTWSIFNGAAAHLLSLPANQTRTTRARAFWGQALKEANEQGFELVSSGASLLIAADCEMQSKEALAYFSAQTRTIHGVTKNR